MAKAHNKRKADENGPKPEKLKRQQFDKELLKLQRELVIMQEYVRANGLKIVVIFEGRDAAGKGGVIKRITERTSPRICRIVALPAPTEREKTQWYFQRYVAHLPAARRDRAVRSLLVQPRRRRAGDGLLHARPSTRSSCAPAPSSSTCWCARTSC